MTRPLVIAAAVILIVLSAKPALAQKDVFVDAFIRLHSALSGTYGDEGPRIAAEFARMEAALTTWNRTGAAAALELKKRAATAGEFVLHFVDHQQLEAAIEATSAAIAAEPARTSLVVFQGQLFEATGRTAEARSAFARARQMDPDDPLAAYFAATRANGGVDLPALVGTLMTAVDRRQVATRPFADLALIEDQAAKIPALTPAAYVPAFAAFSARRYREAVEEFRTVIARDPLLTDPAVESSAFVAAAAAMRATNGAAAVTMLEAAVKLAPESSESRRALGNAYRAVDRLAEAIVQFEIAVRLRPDDERSRVALGTTLAQADRLEDAERELRATVRTLPTSATARWALADVFDRQRRGLEALTQLEEAATLPIVAGRVHLLRRFAETTHLYAQDLGRFISLVSQMARLAPNDASGHRDLGLAYHRAGRDDEGAIELLLLVLMGREDGETLGALGQIHFNAGRFARAESVLRRAAALDPKRAQVRYVLAQTLQQLGRHMEAEDALAEFDKLRVAALDEQRRRFERANRAAGEVAQ